MNQPTYEGRALPRPDEDLVDQGLAFDLETMDRRRVLRFAGLGAGAAILAACGADGSKTSSTSSSTATSSASGALTEIPDETAGPYPGDGSNGPNVLTEDGIIRSDITSSFGDFSGTAEGVPATIDLTVLNMADGAAFAGAAVYVWHCDRGGNYSLYSEGATDQNYLRGVRIADAAGTVSFTSIFPACYSGRWPHIHFEVYPDQESLSDSTKAIATSQIAIPQEACNAVYATSGYDQSVSNLAQISLTSDNVFGEDGGATQLATMSGDVASGYTIALTAAIDLTTTPSAGAAPGGGGPGGAPPGGRATS